MKQRSNWLVSLFMMLVCAVFGIADGSSFVTAEAVVVDGHEGVGKHITRDGLTTDITRTESPDLILDTVDQRITKMRPSATPLDQIMRHATPKNAGTMIFGYYSTDIRPVKATITEPYVVPGTPSQSAVLTIDNGHLFDVSDTILVPSVAGYNEQGVATPKIPLVLYVQAVGATNQITVQAVNGPTISGQVNRSVPAIGDNAVIYRMGRAAAEGDVQTSPYSALPTKEQNYCQIFKCQVEQTTIMNMSDKEVPWTPTDQEEQALYEWRLGIEASYLFGTKGYFYDNAKKRYVYSTGGIVHNITKEIEYPTSTAITDADLVDISKDIFTGNSGDKRRLLFAGSDLVVALSKNSSVQKQLEAGNTEVVWGIKWNKISTNFGDLLLLQHELLDMYGWSEKGIVLDPAHIDKYVFKGIARDVLDLKKAGTYDGDVAVNTEISGLALKYPGVHAVLAPGT